MKNLLSSYEIDIAGLAGAIVRRWGIFFTAWAVVMLLTVGYLHIVPQTYTVQMSVAPVMASNQQLGGGLSALARLGGVDLSNLSGGEGQFRLFINALKLPDVANEVAKDQKLMIGLFPAQWSETEQRWKPRTGALHSIADGVRNFLGLGVTPWHAPGGDEMQTLLDNDLEVDDDPKSAVITLRMQSATPDAARALLEKLTQVIDAKLRQQALARADDYIVYLNSELNKVTVADYRATLVERLSQQEQIRMMASADVSFAAQVFSGPSVSPLPTAPKSTMVLFSGLLFGAIFAGFVAIQAERQRWGWPRLVHATRARLGALPPSGGTA